MGWDTTVLLTMQPRIGSLHCGTLIDDFWRFYWFKIYIASRWYEYNEHTSNLRMDTTNISIHIKITLTKSKIIQDRNSALMIEKKNFEASKQRSMTTTIRPLFWHHKDNQKDSSAAVSSEREQRSSTIVVRCNHQWLNLGVSPWIFCPAVLLRR